MKLGVVVPTLGTREDYLYECIQSIRAIEGVFICVVGPISRLAKMKWLSSKVSIILDDPHQGPAAAINLGIRSLPSTIELVTWIGDDDLLDHVGVEKEIAVLDANPAVSATFGNCRYIDKNGVTFWVNVPGQRAAHTIKWGKNSIPQPGSIYRRDCFSRIGGLDQSLGWAFDQDLFHRFAQNNELLYVNATVASFRWHSESLSMGHIRKSMNESRKVRQKYMSKPLRIASNIWEIPKIWLATLAGSRLTRLSNRAGE